MNKSESFFSQTKNLIIVIIASMVLRLFLTRTINILNIIMNTAYLGFFVFTLLGKKNKKLRSVGKYYLFTMLGLSFINNISIFINVLSSADDIFGVSNFIYTLIPPILELICLFFIVVKNNYKFNKLFITTMLLGIIFGLNNNGGFIGLIRNLLNINIIISIVSNVLVGIYFYNYEKNYYGFFDDKKRLNKKENFNFEEWLLYIIILIFGVLIKISSEPLDLIFLIMGLFVVYMFFVNKSFIKWKKKTEENRIKNNPAYIAGKEIYGLISSSSLETQITELVINTSLDKGNVYEAHAALHEFEARKNEKELLLVSSKKEDIINEVNNLFENNIRPELISKAIYKKCNDLSNSNLETLIKKAYNKFNDNIDSIVNNIRIQQKNSSDYLYEQYKNSPDPKGLGFDIITNSTSHAVLYQAMNIRKVEKELKNQRVSYKNSVVRSTENIVINYVENVKNCYLKYKEDVLEILNKEL